MNNRIGIIIASIVAAVAIIFAIVQSGNLSQTETKLVAAQSTATAQQSAFSSQGTAAVATLSAANTLAADTANAAGTAQAQALTDAENAAATAQAKALADAAQAASTLQAQALAAAAQAAATAEAQAAESAKNTAATAQANALSTAQAQSTGTLVAVMDAAGEAQATAVVDAQQVAATAQSKALATAQAQATATLGAVVAQAATNAAQTEQSFSATQNAVATQLAEANTALATAQANTSTTVNPTAEPTNQAADIPDNWRRYVGKGIAIQLPDGYIGSELGSDPEELGQMLRSLGADFEAAAQLFEQNPDIMAFIAVHPGGRGIPPSSIVVLTLSVPIRLPLDALLDATEAQLPRGAKVLEREIVEIAGYEAGRLIMETDIGFITTKQVQYLIIEDQTLYLVGFTAQPDDFEILLDSFDRSMTTFEILSNSDI